MKKEFAALPYKKEKELRKEIKKILKKYDNPGVSIVATRNLEKPIFEYYAGLASAVPGENWKVKNDTVFLIASVSKLITVTSLLHCIEKANIKRKKKKKKPITIHSTIEKYLPFTIQNPLAPNHKITFQQLLNHTSGIVDNFHLEKFLYTTKGDSPITLGEFSKWYLSPTPKGKKGHTVPKHPEIPFYDKINFDQPGIFSYSNAAYSLIGYLVECVAKKELGKSQQMWKYCTENILKPLGIGNDGKYAGRFKLAQLKAPKNKRARPGQLMPYYAFTGYSNGGFRCTGLALGRIMSMLLNKGSLEIGNKKVKILSEKTVKQITDFTGRNSPWQTLCSYGFGFRTDLVKADPMTAPLSPVMPKPRLTVGHTGGEHGVATCLYWVENPNDPSKNIGVLVLTNKDWPDTGNGVPLDAVIAVLDAFQKS